MYGLSFFGLKAQHTRLLGVIIDSLSILILSLLLQIIVKSKVITLLGASLYGVNPLIFWLSRNARMYPMFILFAITSFYFFNKEKWKYYFLFTLLMLFSHYFTVLIVFSQVLMALYKRKFLKWIRTGTLLGILYTPIILFIIIPKILDVGPFKESLSWLVNSALSDIIPTFKLLFFQYPFQATFLGWVILGLILIGLNKNTLHYLFPIITFFIVVFSSHLIGFSFYNIHYLSPIIPIIILLITSAVSRLKIIGKLILITLIVMSIFSFTPNYSSEKTFNDIQTSIFKNDANAAILYYPAYYALYHYDFTYNASATQEKYWMYADSSFRDYFAKHNNTWLIFSNLSGGEYLDSPNPFLGGFEYTIAYKKGITTVVLVKPKDI